MPNTLWSKLAGLNRRELFRRGGLLAAAGALEVVVAEVAAGEGRADGLRTLPALELQAIGVKDIPVGHGYRPCCPGIKTKWLKA